VAGGVRVDYIVTHDSALDFAFFGTNANVTSKGLGSLSDAGAGGKFASLRLRRYPFAFAGNDLGSVGFGSVRDSGIGGIFE